MSDSSSADAAAGFRRLMGLGVLVAVTVLSFAGLTAPAQAKIATTVSGFPGPTATIAPGADWSVAAKVSGPVGRPVSLQRKSGGTWTVVSAVKTGPKGAVKIKIKKAKAGSYRLAVPVSGRYAAKVSGVQTLIVNKQKFINVPLVVNGPFTGFVRQLVWRGLVSLKYVSHVGPGGFKYEIESISGTWQATSHVDPDGSTYSGSGTFNLDNVDMAFSRSFNYYDPTFGFAGHNGRYSFSQQMPAGQSIQLTKTPPPPDPPQTINFGFVPWIRTNAIEAVTGHWILPVTSDPAHFYGSFIAPDGSGGSEWNLTGEPLVPVPIP